MGPRQPCHCGRDEIQKRCVDTAYEGGWSCGHPCGDSLPCGEHSCPKPCHPGVCGECQILQMLKCFCGNNTKGIRCSDQKEPVECTISDIHGVENWLGYWDCHSPCNRFVLCFLDSIDSLDPLQYTKNIGILTARNILAKSLVILKMRSPPAALAHRNLSLIAPVAGPRSVKFLNHLGPIARQISRCAIRSVERFLGAAINVIEPATKVNVLFVSRSLISNASVARPF